MPMLFTFGTQKKTGFTLVFLIILFLTAGSSYANKVKQSIAAKKLVPECLLYWNSGPEYAVLVDKSRQKVMIYKRGELYSPYKVYDCSTGENFGPKQIRNDRKTPEGIYFFVKYFEDESLAPIYGTRALPLDYPNIVDKKNGKGGYGIWFHGTNKVLKPHDTNGCVALVNSDVEDLAKIVTLFETPVIISSEIKMVPEGVNEDQRKNILEIIESWKKSWEEKDIDKYMSFYSSQFKSGWKDWSKWKTYKAQLAKNYKYIDVEINNLNLFFNKDIIIASFEQSYRTPSFDSFGVKKLYLTQNSPDWRILSETFKGIDRAKAQVQMVSEVDEQEIEDFILLWKDAWENKDISAYISCYDQDFKSRGMGIDAWKKHRSRLNEKYDNISVEISNIKVSPLSSDDKLKVSFTQVYKADSYRDKGRKDILLVRKGEYWKIMDEDWKAIR